MYSRRKLSRVQSSVVAWLFPLLYSGLLQASGDFVSFPPKFPKFEVQIKNRNSNFAKSWSVSQCIEPYFAPPYFAIDPYFARFLGLRNRKIRENSRISEIMTRKVNIGFLFFVGVIMKNILPKVVFKVRLPKFLWHFVGPVFLDH